MRRAIVLMLLLAAASIPAAPALALPEGTEVRLYKGGLSFPVDMAWVEGTRKLFFTEKNTGKVRVMRRGELLAEPCVDLTVNSSGERGLLGIALHPAFSTNPYLYVFYTATGTPSMNHVVRYEVVDNACVNPLEIGDAIPAGPIHNGGQLEFVNGYLFVSTGDDGDPANAQDTDSLAGKVLRYNPDGTIPDDNPYVNPVWSWGHRNVFGLGHRPGTGQLFASENGPSCDDELNRIQEGLNFGWGSDYECGQPVGPDPEPPVRSWTPVVVPTDLTWYDGRIERMSGQLYMGSFHGRLYRFNMSNDGTQILRTRIPLRLDEGILDVSEGPRGWLYVLTVDSILRIVEPQAVSAP